MDSTSRQKKYVESQRKLNRKKRGFFLTETEFTRVKKFIEGMRNE